MALLVLFAALVLGTVSVHLWLSRTGLPLPVLRDWKAFLRLGFIMGVFGSIVVFLAMLILNWIVQQPITVDRIARVLIEGFVTFGGGAVLAYVIIRAHSLSFR